MGLGFTGVLRPSARRRRAEAREEARRRDERFDELRAVIDAACMALVHASERSPDAGTTVRHQDAGHQAQRLDEAAREVDAAGIRMAAHLGAEHEVVQRYDEIRRCMQEMVSALRRGGRTGSLDAGQIQDLQEGLEQAQSRFFEGVALGGRQQAD
jgi:hypothetical protein